MKKKAMIMAVASLGSMALIGTGFAGWVISANTTADASGVMVAYDVKDQRLNAAKGKWKNGVTGAAAAGDKGEIIFGKPATMNVLNPWLTCDDEDGMKVQRLSDTYVFVVSTADKENTGKFTVATDTDKGAFVVTDTKGAWAAATTGKTNLVNADPVITFDQVEYVLVKGQATVEMTITFEWGTAFGNENPYVHYNKTPNPSEDLTNEALANLEKVKALKDIAFTVNLSIKAAA